MLHNWQCYKNIIIIIIRKNQAAFCKMLKAIEQFSLMSVFITNEMNPVKLQWNNENSITQYRPCVKIRCIKINKHILLNLFNNSMI